MNGMNYYIMTIKEKVFVIMDQCLQNRSFKIQQNEQNLDDVIVLDYINKKKKIGIAWNGLNGYFIIQKRYARKPICSTFLIRFNELKSDQELIDDMEYILNEWNV